MLRENMLRRAKKSSPGPKSDKLLLFRRPFRQREALKECHVLLSRKIRDGCNEIPGGLRVSAASGMEAKGGICLQIIKCSFWCQRDRRPSLCL